MRKFAFVFLQDQDGAKKLIEKTEFQNNPNIHVFSHDLARDLINEKS